MLKTSAPAAPTYTPAGVVPPPPGVARPNNYLVHAILVTLFCCLPFGIVAIIYAAQVNSNFDRGDYPGAERASQQAKLWSWVAFGVGAGFTLLWFCLMALGVVGSILGGHTTP